MSTIVQVKGERWVLLPERAVYWPARRILVLGDAHLGKAMHFRKLGVPAPAAVEAGDLGRLHALLTRFDPAEIILLGDLFHSAHNTAWAGFAELRRAFGDTRFTLIIGNHDILDPAAYAAADLHLMDARAEGPFRFTHHPGPDAGGYNVAGHVHPSVRLVGKGRQTLELPCFHFGRTAALLPAFGAFTGRYRVQPVNGDRVFAVGGGSVWRVAG